MHDYFKPYYNSMASIIERNDEAVLREKLQLLAARANEKALDGENGSGEKRTLKAAVITDDNYLY